MESTGRPTTTFVRPFLTAARSARPRTDGPAPAAAGSPQRGTAHLQGGPVFRGGRRTGNCGAERDRTVGLL